MVDYGGPFFFEQDITLLQDQVHAFALGRLCKALHLLQTPLEPCFDIFERFEEPFALESNQTKRLNCFLFAQRLFLRPFKVVAHALRQVHGVNAQELVQLPINFDLLIVREQDLLALRFLLLALYFKLSALNFPEFVQAAIRNALLFVRTLVVVTLEHSLGDVLFFEVPGLVIGIIVLFLQLLRLNDQALLEVGLHCISDTCVKERFKEGLLRFDMIWLILANNVLID